MLWLLCCVLCCAAMRQWNSSLSVRGGGSCQAERLLHISFEYYTAYTLEVRNRRSQPVRALGLCLQHAALLVSKAAPHLFGFEVSLPCSQEPPAVVYPESVECCLHPSSFFEIHFNIVLSPTHRSSKPSFSFRFCNRDCMHFLLYHACNMPRPSHLHRFEYNS